MDAGQAVEARRFLSPPAAGPKTITVRHWETSDREVGRSKCPVVMTGIAVGKTAGESRADLQLVLYGKKSL
jgi:hypothetical protein